MTMKASSQPQALASSGMVSGANSAPIEAPALKKDRAYATSIFNAGASSGANSAPIEAPALKIEVA